MRLASKNIVRKAEAGSPTRGLRTIEMQGNFRKLASSLPISFFQQNSIQESKHALARAASGLVVVSFPRRSIPTLRTCEVADPLILTGAGELSATFRSLGQA